MRWVTVTHPVTGGTARISESALPYHLRSGWQPVTAPAGAPGPGAGESSQETGQPGEAGEDPASQQETVQKGRRNKGPGETERTGQ